MNPVVQLESTGAICSNDNSTVVVIAGFGSPHGDDQAGWETVARLARRPDLQARLVTITEGTRLLDELDACRWLIAVDACRGGGPVGSVTRLTWPDPRILQRHNHSTHGVGLCNALQLAERLGWLPPRVDILGIQIGDCRPMDEPSPEIVRAVSELERDIAAEVGETAYA